MSDFASSSGTGCPSLSRTLRQFRPRRRCAQQSTAPTAPLPDKCPEPKNEPKPTSREKKDSILIPKTLQSALYEAVQELAQSRRQEHPDTQASCSSSNLEESEAAGSGVQWKRVPSSNSEGDEGPKKLGGPHNSAAKKPVEFECSAKDVLRKRYMTNRERSLKELRKEFKTTDIETVLQALVACQWNVSQARAYLLDEPHVEGNRQQSGQESEGIDFKPNLANLTEALRKRGFCDDDVYVENLTRGLCQVKYLGGFRQPQPEDNRQRKSPRDTARHPRTRKRRTESTLKKAGQESAQSSVRGGPDIPASCSSSGDLREIEAAGKGVERRQVSSSIAKEGEGPKKLVVPVYNRAKKTMRVECSVECTTDRERSLKELKEEFKFADIEPILAALVACNWNLVQAQAYLRNKFRFMGYSQQSSEESELANRSGTFRERDEEAQHRKEASEGDDDGDNEDSRDENTRGGERPDAQTTCSTSNRKENRAAGSGARREKAFSRNSEGDKDSLVEHTRNVTDRERSLKKLRKEFKTTGIVGSAVLAALVACKWDVGQARAYLVNKFGVMGHSQQHGQGAEGTDMQPSSANLSGAPGKHDRDGGEDIYVKNLEGGLSKVVFCDIGQHQPGEVSEAEGNSDSEDFCDDNMYVKDLKGGLSKLRPSGTVSTVNPRRTGTVPLGAETNCS